MPWFDHVWRRNPILLYLKPAHRSTPLVTMARAEIEDRELRWQRGKPRLNDDPTDILHSFMAARDSEPATPEMCVGAEPILP